jgi:hypothetical protein
MNIPLDAQIELGNETERWDARVCNSGMLILEVTQALPEGEHESRLNLITGIDPASYYAHAADARQFPDAIIAAIREKAAKGYRDKRTLVVVVSGDYTGEDDSIIESWLPIIREQATQGDFAEVLLVERDRQKTFKIF